MTTARWNRVRDVFERALEVEPPGRAALVAREADDDAEVAAEVMSLLDHHSRAGEFLSAPAAGRVAHLLDDSPGFAEGAVIGVYVIVREIGRGGMGRVYLAHDSRLGRRVALKALPPALVRDQAQRERLRREARAAAGLTHPGICTVYALEEQGDDVFIVSEFVDGRTLRDIIESGERPSGEELQNIAVGVGDALGSAHARGITHRDLKPENVMRADDGRLKILDFGLARVAPVASFADEPRVTLPGMVVGTPAYMAPEQLNGREADFRSDIFALGIVLHELATGMHPFASDTSMGLAARILESEPAALRAVRSDVPARLAAAIDRCLRKRPDDRFGSGADFVRALDGAGLLVRDGSVAPWWRAHQIVAIALYLSGVVAAWRIKEWVHTFTDTGFLIVGAAAMVGGVFRGHMLFTERMNPSSFEPERRRAAPVTLGVDLLIGLVLAAEGWVVATTRPVVGVLAIAFGVAISLARLVVEPSTTRGAFGEQR